MGIWGVEEDDTKGRACLITTIFLDLFGVHLPHFCFWLGESGVVI